MTVNKYFNRLKNIDLLIQSEGTGSPKELATKLNISERMIFRYIQNLKVMGAPITYNHRKKSYIYTDEVYLNVDVAYRKRIVAS